MPDIPLSLRKASNNNLKSDAYFTLTGNLVHGSTITVDSAVYDFGTKPTQQPAIWDTFQSYTAGQSLESQNPAWVHYTGAGATVGALIRSTDSRYTGSKSAYRVHSNTLNTDFETNYRISTPSKKRRISYWHKNKFTKPYANTPSDGQGVDQTQIKMSRLGVDSSNAYTGAGLHFLTQNFPALDDTHQVSYLDGVSGTGVALGSLIIPPNQWNRIDILTDLSTAGTPDGTYIVRCIGNGQAVNGINIATRGSGQTFLHSSLLLPLMVANITASNLHGDVDLAVSDVYVDNSWSLIEIGNRATYALCLSSGKLEPQPHTLWSSSQVKVTANIAGFTSGETLYLYFTNNNGVVSLPLLIGVAP